MLGQTRLRELVTQQIQDGTFPHFCILNGAVGSGKKTFIDEVIIPSIGGIKYPVEVSIEGIREMIKQAYTINTPIVYVIQDADKLSVPAKNALLKVTEEPPNDTYIIMTLENMDNTLSTIRSRSTVYSMDIYSGTELREYYEKVCPDGKDLQVILDLCENPGEIDALINIGVAQFYDYVEQCVDNVAETTISNVFKLGDKLSLKQGAEGYDLKLFFKAFISVCLTRAHTGDTLKYTAGISITSKFLQQISINGVSKQMLLDDWILEMRQAWE